MKTLFALLSLFLAATPVLAGPELVVENAWVREAPPGARMLAAYLVIRNTGDRDAELVEVESPAFAHVMLHKSETVDGMARMVHLDSLAIPAHGSVTLEPGGLHLMMPAPEKRLTAGDEVELRLHFADGHTLRATAVVRKKP